MRAAAGDKEAKEGNEATQGHARGLHMHSITRRLLWAVMLE
jgi:hypothetical protein